MRILEVINSLELAGAERLVHDLCLEFQRRRVSVSVYLLNATGGPLEHSLRAAGIPIFASGRKAARAPGQAFRFGEHLRRHDYDIVHAHLFPAQLWAGVGRRLSASGARFYTTEHSFTTRRRCWAAKPFDAWLYGQFDAVCCVSEAAAMSFRTWLPQYRYRTLTVHNGIDGARFSGSPAGDRQPTRIISVGRCEPVKRHDVTLRALARLPETSLWIVGDGPCRPQLTELAASLGIAGRVQFLGRRSDLECLLPQCGVFVQSSAHEGFGLAALEAMACGLPIVCSDIPGLADAVGPAALKFAPGSDASLAGCLRSVLTNPHLAAAMSRAGMDQASGFSIARTADEYLRLYGVPPVASGGAKDSPLKEVTA